MNRPRPRVICHAALLLSVACCCCAGCRQKGDSGSYARATRETTTAASANAPREVSASPPDAKSGVPVYGFEVVNQWPHDRKAFTQGLVYMDGAILESAGQYGHSSLRRIELETGKVLKKVDLPPQYFAEGLTLLRGKLYQLTWRENKGFIYDAATFRLENEFYFDGEGWGLTNDGESLILSDGTSQLRFIDPANFMVKRTLGVKDRGRPLRDLNELEYVKGEIYANVWHTDRIARIDPRTGAVVGWIDLGTLLSPSERGDEEAVLNGVAYDDTGDRLFVTGKLWPKLFEIRLKQ